MLLDPDISNDDVIEIYQQFNELNRRLGREPKENFIKMRLAHYVHLANAKK